MRRMVHNEKYVGVKKMAMTATAGNYSGGDGEGILGELRAGCRKDALEARKREVAAWLKHKEEKIAFFAHYFEEEQALLQEKPEKHCWDYYRMNKCAGRVVCGCWEVVSGISFALLRLTGPVYEKLLDSWDYDSIWRVVRDRLAQKTENVASLTGGFAFIYSVMKRMEESESKWVRGGDEGVSEQDASRALGIANGFLKWAEAEVA